MQSVTIDTSSIKDGESFHDLCGRAFGFPDFYGRNMDAWIDCLSDLTEHKGMSRFTLDKDEQLHIHVPEFESFNSRLPDLASTFLECTAAVNARYIDAGDIPRLVLVLA